MGSGGVGGYYGGRLARAGHAVTFIARGAHLAALRRKGLQVFSHFGDFHLPRVQVTDVPAEAGPAELVIVATKAYDLEAAAAALRPVVAAETAVLPLLNGVDIAERLGAVLGATINSAHVLGGVCGISSALAEPGVIRQVSPFEYIALGERDGRVTPRAQAVAAALKQAGINAKLSDDIRRDIWAKFIFLTANAGLCALTRQVTGAVRADPDTRALLQACITEVVAVARAQGVDLGEDAPEQALSQIDRAPESLKPSLLLDLERRNRLELDALTGTVLRMAGETGVAAPVNRFIYAALTLHAQGH